jgi:phosphoglycolate phosphatase/pyrophosphatase PpaX
MLVRYGIMNYLCLLIDHDDTAVDSTPSVHHKAHIEQMHRLGREDQILSLPDWFRINYDPGLVHYMNEVLRLTREEQQLCYSIWREYTTTLVPPFFPGILPLLKRFSTQGGIVVVVSHSEPDIIRRHYAEQLEVPGFIPHLIIGWTGDREKNKPFTWPVETVLENYALSPEELLVVDDLKPGITMARNAGIASVGVGWSHQLEELKQDIRAYSTYYAETVEELEQLIFSKEKRRPAEKRTPG